MRRTVGRRGRLIAYAAVAIGLSMIVFAVSRTFALSLASQFVIGLGASVWIATVPTVLQTTVSDEMRGRVMGVFFMAIQFMGFGWIAGGAAAEALGNQTALVIAGIAFAGFNLLAYAKSRALREVD
jgi:MFS family permease